MVSKAQKVRLGIFLAIGSFLLILFFGAVAGSRLVQKRDIYYIEFADYSISGMQVGGAVNFSGIRIGRVDAIRIDPNDVSKIILTISIQEGTPIKEDAEAVLTPVGITGLKAVEIRGGTNAAATLKPRSFIKAGTSMFDDITDRAVSIADKIDIISANIADMTGDENRENIAKILLQTSLLLEETRKNIAGTLTSLNTIAANAAKISEAAGGNLDKITDNLTKNMDELTSTTTRNIDAIGAQSNASLEAMTKQLSTEINLLTTNLNQGINELTNQTSFLLQDTRYHLNAIGSHSDILVVQTTKQLAEISANINESLTRVNQLISNPYFDSLLVNVNTLSGQLAEANLKTLISELSLTVKNTGNLVSNVDRTFTRSRSNIVETLDALREASENLNEFSKQIADDPSILIRGY